MTQPILITQAQLEARLSKRRVARIYDDNRDGAGDKDPIDQLRKDASSKVLSYLAPLGIGTLLAPFFNATTGDVTVTDPVTVLDPELVRLTLDVAFAMAAQRHPTIMQMDWVALMKQVEADLTNVRLGKTSLVMPSLPAANNGVKVVDDSPIVTNYGERSQRFWDDPGDF